MTISQKIELKRTALGAVTMSLNSKSVLSTFPRPTPAYLTALLIVFSSYATHTFGGDLQQFAPLYNASL